MKIVVLYNMEKTRFGLWFMEGFPAKFHAFPFVGLMTFTGPKEKVREALVKHELLHAYQAQREGWLIWNIKYYYYQMTVGYRLNPYEIEAYDNMWVPMTHAEWKLVGFTPTERGLAWLPK